MMCVWANTHIRGIFMTDRIRGFNKPLGHARTQSDKPGQEDQPAPRAEKKLKQQARTGHIRAQSTGWGVEPTRKKEAKQKFANLTGTAGVLKKDDPHRRRQVEIEVASYEKTEIRDNPDAEKKVSVKERIRQFELEAQPSIISTGKAPEPAPSITTTTTTTTTTSSAPKKPLPPLPARPEDRPTAGETPMSPRRDAKPELPSLNTSKSEKPS
jgi:hypothetical protein